MINTYRKSITNGLRACHGGREPDAVECARTTRRRVYRIRTRQKRRISVYVLFILLFYSVYGPPRPLTTDRPGGGGGRCRPPGLEVETRGSRKKIDRYASNATRRPVDCRRVSFCFNLIFFFRPLVRSSKEWFSVIMGRRETPTKSEPPRRRRCLSNDNDVRRENVTPHGFRPSRDGPYTLEK